MFQTRAIPGNLLRFHGGSRPFPPFPVILKYVVSLQSHWKLIENRTDLPRQLLGEFSLEVQGCLRKSPEEGVPEGWIFRSSLLRLSGLSRRITGGFSTQLTESLFKKLWIPAFFRGAYLSNLASHKASRNPTHKNLWHHPLFEEIHP